MSVQLSPPRGESIVTMNLNVSGESLTLSLVPPAGQIFSPIQSHISEMFQDELRMEFCAIGNIIPMGLY